MITYKATNINTGCYYIGSAKTYCHYINRMGCHHLTYICKHKYHNHFHKDLWESPKDFVWEILREDDLTTRDYERELLRECRNDPLNYNLIHNSREVENELEDGARWSKDTKEKMRASAKSAKAQPAHKKAAQSRAVSETNSKQQPCPCCGKLMNIGNLTRHLKSPRNQCTLHIG